MPKLETLLGGLLRLLLATVLLLCGPAPGEAGS
jgi:hypothetical protein